MLCPSFYRAEIVRNATWRDRALFRLRQKVIGWLGGPALSLRGASNATNLESRNRRNPWLWIPGPALRAVPE